MLSPIITKIGSRASRDLDIGQVTFLAAINCKLSVVEKRATYGVHKVMPSLQVVGASIAVGGGRSSRNLKLVPVRMDTTNSWHFLR